MPAGFPQFSLVLGLVSYLVIKALVVLRNYRVINRPIFLLLAQHDFQLNLNWWHLSVKGQALILFMYKPSIMP